ncbi:hypothetical protein VNO78_23417 [Psophocarpus tetragonolobus]|uniref:Uncharacterized protein n=1 Tax=Psophocarpus tetragonolobus TaxID=3891 RepID=A0AAN9S4F9_PSOTE
MSKSGRKSDRSCVHNGEILWVGIGDSSIEHLEDIAMDFVAGIENVTGSSCSFGTSHNLVLLQHYQSTQPLQGMNFSFKPLDDIQVEWGHFTSCCKKKPKKHIAL